MKYVSIDIETTGLDKYQHQILEIAAIAQELCGKELSRFGTVVRYDDLTGSRVALRMNVRLIHQMDENPDLPNIDEALRQFFRWMKPYMVDGKINAVGKNFATFDGPFISQAVLEMEEPIVDSRWYHRRVLDPCSLFLTRSDEVPPDLDECLRRAGIAPSVYQKHHAISDAEAVRDVIEWHYTR